MNLNLQLFFQQLLNGLTLGMVYALIALGYTMVYGILQLINFAHGEVFMVGGYLALTAMGLLAAIWTGAPFFLVLICVLLFSILGCSLLGSGIERAAYRPLRGSPKLTALISSIGVSFALQNTVMLIYGSREKSVPSLLPDWQMEVQGVTISLIQLIIFGVTLALMAGLNFFIKNTKIGKAMRAISENPEAASLMGIPSNLVIQFTFVLGSSLAAVGGSLFAINYGSMNFHDGYLAGIKAFTAAVLGGIGSIPGAMVGGVVLGILEGFAAGYISSEWKDVLAFAALVALLLFKPSGILGENVPEKV